MQRLFGSDLVRRMLSVLNYTSLRMFLPIPLASACGMKLNLCSFLDRLNQQARFHFSSVTLPQPPKPNLICRPTILNSLDLNRTNVIDPLP